MDERDRNSFNPTENFDFQETIGDWTTTTTTLRGAHLTTERNIKTGRAIMVVQSNNDGEYVIENPTREQVEEIFEKYSPKDNERQ